MITVLRNFLTDIWGALLGTKKHVKIGLYGSPNSGKTTLANRICKDVLNSDTDFTEISPIAHETRRVHVKEKLLINKNGRKIEFDLIDTPGIATRIDYEHFVKAGMSQKQAKLRAREATRGVIESIRWLDTVDMVVVLIDSTKNPYNQVNITIIGNLEARSIPVIIAANKIDLKSSNMEKIKKAFPKYEVIGISAKFSKNIDQLYDQVFAISRKVKRR